jgi:hypothetical protein
MRIHQAAVAAMAALRTGTAAPRKGKPKRTKAAATARRSG